MKNFNVQKLRKSNTNISIEQKLIQQIWNKNKTNKNSNAHENQRPKQKINAQIDPKNTISFKNIAHILAQINGMEKLNIKKKSEIEKKKYTISTRTNLTPNITQKWTK